MNYVPDWTEYGPQYADTPETCEYCGEAVHNGERICGSCKYDLEAE